jgi:rhamnose transport system substrate-binding protein
MRKQHKVGAILAAVALATGGGLAGASGDTTVPGTEPAGTEPAGTEPMGTATEGTAAPAGEAVTFETGLEFQSILLPKFTGIAVFDQANQGAQEAAAELEAQPAEFLGPTAENSVAGQIEIMTNAATQGVNAVMLSNNAGDQIVPAAQSVVDAGGVVVTWDSPIPTAEAESVFVAQVDFDETGQVMADMARSILGEDGGQLAILSASPDATNQNEWIEAFNAVLEGEDYANIEVVDTVYGNDQSEESYNQALALVDQYPDLELIMAPTTVGIAAAAKAMQDEGLCEDIKVSGLGLPDEMREFTESGCAPEFALWSFVDLGYLTYYTTYGIATGQIEAAEGATFNAGRLGTYTIETDPTRDAGLRVLMGPFSIYNAENIGEEAAAPATTAAAAEAEAPAPATTGG